MQYELECGHCGYLFTLEGPLPRSVKCSVCGAMLTLAVAVPIIPKEAPKPDPPPPEIPELPAKVIPVADWPSFPSLLPDRPALADLEPALRARHLRLPWPRVYRAINSARGTAEVTRAFYVLYVTFALLGLALLPAREEHLKVLSYLAAIFLLPAVIHVFNQIVCTQVPHTHGGGLVSGSVGMLSFSVAGLMGWLPGPPGLVFILVAVVAVTTSFGLWLAFLARLGQRLGDRDLLTAARSYNSWFWFGFVVIVVLACGACLLGESVLLWLCCAGVSVIGMLLLQGYASLLCIASLAVARRGPVMPAS